VRIPDPAKVRLFQEIGRRLDRKGFIASNDGNLSMREADGTLLVTAAGSRKGYLRAQDILRVDAAGSPLAGIGVPSSETGMHVAIYRMRPDVHAVVHAHPPAATGFSVAREPMDACVLPEIVSTLGSVPLAAYATPGTRELGESLAPLLGGHDVILLANHGAVAVGPNLEEAYFRMERLEHTARILLAARLLGRVEMLSQAEVEHLLGVGRPEGATCVLPCRPAEESGGEVLRVPSIAETPDPGETPPVSDRLAEVIAQVLERRGLLTPKKE
jgi:L-fuculose-phosphate aldolase